MWSSQYYGQRTKKQDEMAAFPAQKYSDYVRDKAIIDTLSAVVLGALAEVIGDDELEKLFKLRGHQYGDIFFAESQHIAVILFQFHYKPYFFEIIDYRAIIFLVPEHKQTRLVIFHAMIVNYGKALGILALEDSIQLVG